MEMIKKCENETNNRYIFRNKSEKIRDIVTYLSSEKRFTINLNELTGQIKIQNLRGNPARLSLLRKDFVKYIDNRYVISENDFEKLFPVAVNLSRSVKHTNPIENAVKTAEDNSCGVPNHHLIWDLVDALEIESNLNIKRFINFFTNLIYSVDSQVETDNRKAIAFVVKSSNEVKPLVKTLQILTYNNIVDYSMLNKDSLISPWCVFLDMFWNVFIDVFNRNVLSYEEIKKNEKSYIEKKIKEMINYVDVQLNGIHRENYFTVVDEEIYNKYLKDNDNFFKIEVTANEDFNNFLFPSADTNDSGRRIGTMWIDDFWSELLTHPLLDSDIDNFLKKQNAEKL